MALTAPGDPRSLANPACVDKVHVVKCQDLKADEERYYFLKNTVDNNSLVDNASRMREKLCQQLKTCLISRQKGNYFSQMQF